MRFQCEECGEQVDKTKIEEILEEQLEEGEGVIGEASLVLDSSIMVVTLIDCPSCEADLATFTRAETDTSEPEESSEGHSKSRTDAQQASDEQSSSNQPFSVV